MVARPPRLCLANLVEAPSQRLSQVRPATKLYVRFVSDGSAVYRGFTARYRGIFIRRQYE